MEFEREIAKAKKDSEDERKRNQNNPEWTKENFPDSGGEGLQASDEAGDLFNVSGRLVREHVRHGGDWRYGLYVARWVEKGAGQGERTDLSENSEKLSKVSATTFAKDAEVSDKTVTKYLNAWNYAAKARVVPHSTSINPGRFRGFKLPTVERKAAVADLAEHGLSNRAVADALNVSRETVNRDANSPDTNVSPTRDRVGQDGKTYTEPRKPKPPQPERLCQSA
ncbi:hypothetical protein B1964_28750 [Gordonia sp. i37]|nr:hypothetical protein B1964_28750 [Gordonia sp. i37]